MSNIVKINPESKKEILGEIARIQNRIAGVVSEFLDDQERTKELRNTLKNSAPAKEIREIAKRRRNNAEILSQSVGGLKVLKRMLKKLGVELEPGKFDKIMLDGEKAKILQEVEI